MANTYEPIASQTFSNVASVTFSGISGSFTDLVLQGYLYGASGNGTASFRVGSSTIDTGSNYSETELYGLGSSVGSQRLSSQTSISIGRATGVGSSDPYIVRVDLMSYSNTNAYKTFIFDMGSAGLGAISQVGLWRSTSPIDNVRVSMAINFTGTLSLYGIRAA